VDDLIESYKNQYRKEINNLILSGYFPPEIVADYDVVGCVSQKEDNETYIIKSKSSGARYILKNGFDMINTQLFLDKQNFKTLGE